MRLLIKYLAGKLGLQDESEVWCSSQLQPPSLKQACHFAFFLACAYGFHASIFLPPLFSRWGACFSYVLFPSPLFLFFFFTLSSPLIDRACFLAFPTSVMKGTRELEKGLVVPYRYMFIYMYICAPILLVFTYIYIYIYNIYAKCVWQHVCKGE